MKCTSLILEKRKVKSIWLYPIRHFVKKYVRKVLILKLLMKDNLYANFKEFYRQCIYLRQLKHTEDKINLTLCGKKLATSIYSKLKFKFLTFQILSLHNFSYKLYKILMNGSTNIYKLIKIIIINLQILISLFRSRAHSNYKQTKQ